MKALGVIAGIVIATIANGFVLKTLWVWFAVPLFPVPHLSIPQALGLSLVGEVLVGTTGVKKEGQPEEPGAAVVTAVLRPLVVLAVGWIVTWFL